ncbi:hypothetical protein SAMN05421858_3599 [Haladaptatus litoreus]|uniref:Uncharacterized protein n=1 Tax=Haladaptatus litoreus TaxID=553468 RepID=A0A1N7DGK3_9EURY|nr:hypothetical protein SAMN05421858_3599 [Haladaptatus litoreus]
MSKNVLKRERPFSIAKQDRSSDRGRVYFDHVDGVMDHLRNFIKTVASHLARWAYYTDRTVHTFFLCTNRCSSPSKASGGFLPVKRHPLVSHLYELLSQLVSIRDRMFCVFRKFQRFDERFSHLR